MEIARGGDRACFLGRGAGAGMGMAVVGGGGDGALTAPFGGGLGKRLERASALAGHGSACAGLRLSGSLVVVDEARGSGGLELNVASTPRAIVRGEDRACCGANGVAARHSCGFVCSGRHHTMGTSISLRSTTSSRCPLRRLCFHRLRVSRTGRSCGWGCQVSTFLNRTQRFDVLHGAGNLPVRLQERQPLDISEKRPLLCFGRRSSKATENVR